MPKKLYIADTHFGHNNCLHFDDRPFKTVKEMDEEIISRWNGAVDPGDIVYILGDFCWDTEDRCVEILKRLNGSKILLEGNHDGNIKSKAKKLLDAVVPYKEVKDNDRLVVLCHYPIPCFKNHFYGAYHLYGHVHNSFEARMTEHDKYLMENLYSRPCNMYNVGCMMPYMDYTPRTLDEIIAGN